MDLIPIPATKPDSPAVSSDAVEAEPGFGNLIESLLSGITGAIGGQSGADGDDVDPDDRGDSNGTVHPLPGLGLPPDTETPANGPPSLPAPFEGWDTDRPSLEVDGDPTRSVSRLGVLATPTSPPTRAGAEQANGSATITPGSTPGGGPAVPAPAATTDEAPKPVPTLTPDEAPKPAPVPVGAPGIPGPEPVAPAAIALPAREATGASRVVGHQPTLHRSAPPPLSGDPDPTATDVTIAQRETGTPEADPETPPGRIEPDMGSPTSESPEGHIARAITPLQGTDRPAMAELVDRIRDWADRVESAQRTDTISLKLADPDGELLVRLAMRDGRLEVNVSRPGGDTPSWLLDQLDDALARRGFDMAEGGDRRGPEDGEAGDTLAEGEQPRQRTTKRDQDGLWM